MTSKGIIAAGHKETCKAGALILENGGNAYDAAIAALMTSFVAEPCMSSPGGGGFMNIVTATNSNEILDFFCHTPRLKKNEDDLDFFPVTIDFGGATEDFHVGMASIGVPGCLAGIYALHNKYGSIPLAELAQPSIELAKSGLSVDPFQAYDFYLLEAILRLSANGLHLFFKNEQLIVEGDHFKMDKMADFLSAFVHEDPRWFYQGEPGMVIAEASERNGGHLIRADLENYQVIWRRPLRLSVNDFDVFTNPLPSVGGETIRLLWSTYNELKGNKEERLAKALQIVDGFKKTKENFENLHNSKTGSTTHISIIDAKGNAISTTVSNGEGSGYFIPGTDVQLNNMLGEAALLPDGFHRWTEDSRLSSMMAPTIAINKLTDTILASGSGGAGRIPSVIMQVLRYVIEDGLDLKTAIQMPRQYYGENTLNLEPGFLSKFENLKECSMTHWDATDMFFGGVHSVTKQRNQLAGFGDQRRFGHSITV